MTTQTTQAPTPQAAAFYREAEETICYLYGRYRDERGQEPIADYAKPLRPIADRCGVRIVKMTARPFGCVFAVGEGPQARTFVLTIDARGRYGYRRTA